MQKIHKLISTVFATLNYFQGQITATLKATLLTMVSEVMENSLES